MRVRSARHKALKAIIELDDGRGIRADQLKRAPNIIAALIHAENMDQVIGPPGWRIHQLVGDRAGTWSISVSGNWRITFDLDGHRSRTWIWRTIIDE
jgi:proteic killer suppression protein